ncbi:MAG: hypothetical protein SWX82_35695 [Cyanobacteriota bacterium]|nr:hypothetical protein [Cyanobacteriota bacterium]
MSRAILSGHDKRAIAQSSKNKLLLSKNYCDRLIEINRHLR